MSQMTSSSKNLIISNNMKNDVLLNLEKSLLFYSIKNEKDWEEKTLNTSRFYVLPTSEHKYFKGKKVKTNTE